MVPSSKPKIPAWAWVVAAVAGVGAYLIVRARGAASSAAPTAASTNAPTQIGGGALTPDQSALTSGVNDLAAYLQANGLTPPPAAPGGVTPGFLGPPAPAPGPVSSGTPPPPIGHVPGGTIIGGGIGPVAD